MDTFLVPMQIVIWKTQAETASFGNCNALVMHTRTQNYALSALLVAVAVDLIAAKKN